MNMKKNEIKKASSLLKEIISTFDKKLENEIKNESHVVLEVENYNGNEIASILIDVSTKEVLDAQTGLEFDGEINLDTFDVADCDGDYIFNTDYLLVRIQES